MELNFNRRALLIGAGFTKNFGGFLAEEMWAVIFNQPEVSNNSKLRLALLSEQNGFDFEFIYHKAKNNNKPYFNLLSQAVKKSYEHLDRLIEKAKDEDIYDIGLNALRDWLARFGEGPKKHGFIFTLNQDILLERLYTNKFSPLVPGMPNEAQCSYVYDKPEIYPVLVPKSIDEGTIKNKLINLNLIKLHGSSNWVKDDGTEAIVIGHGKREAIGNEPILNFNFNLFKEFISQQDPQLWIIGYGFGDPHINKALIHAVQNNNLQLFIISPSLPKKAKELIAKKARHQNKANILWHAIHAYFPLILRDIFPKRRSPTTHYDSINKLM